ERGARRRAPPVVLGVAERLREIRPAGLEIVGDARHRTGSPPGLSHLSGPRASPAVSRGQDSRASDPEPRSDLKRGRRRMILVHQRYTAKPGLRERVLATRVEASRRLA